MFIVSKFVYNKTIFKMLTLSILTYRSQIVLFAVKCIKTDLVHFKNVLELLFWTSRSYSYKPEVYFIKMLLLLKFKGCPRPLIIEGYIFVARLPFDVAINAVNLQLS
jgi:hypothetical protein